MKEESVSIIVTVDQQDIQAAALGVFGALALSGVYRFIRTDWPEAYVFARNLLERFQRKSFWQYLLLRTGPAVVVFYLVAATALRLGVPPGIGVVTAGICFALLTDVRAMRNAIRLRDSRLTILMTMYIINLMVTASMAWIGLRLAKWSIEYAPTPNAMVEGLWIAGLVTAMAAFVRTLIGREYRSDSDRVRDVIADITPAIWEYTIRASERHGIDSALACAVISAECSQRPRWVRRVERLIGRVRGFGTYGVAQIPSSRPLSDEESVDRLVEEMKSAPRPDEQSQWAAWEQVRPWVEARNASLDFRAAVGAFFGALYVPPMSPEPDPARDLTSGNAVMVSPLRRVLLRIARRIVASLDTGHP